MFLHEREYGLELIKGIGAKYSESLSRLGISYINDLLEFFPVRYEERKTISLFPREDLFEGKTCQLMTVFTPQEHVFFGSSFKKTLKIRAKTINDENFELICFNRNFLSNVLKLGSHFFIYAKFTFKFNIWTCSSFEIEPFSENPKNFGKIVAIYPLSTALNNKKLSSYISTAISQYQGVFEDDIPIFLREKYSLFSLKEALNEIHFPNSFESLEKARKTLIYREFFLLQVFSRRKGSTFKERERRDLSVNWQERLIKSLSFQLTQDQDIALKEIHKDLSSSKPMNRLLQGDVGSGKTLVALLSALPILERGEQVAFMVPTDLLARQHFLNIKKLLLPFKIKTELLSAALKKSFREELLKDLERGEINLLIGTHSLFSISIKFKNLTYIIIDEQHKFGVLQRENLRGKAEEPDVLLMSATPIPRSLALTMFGDLDISLIKTMPEGRKNIITYLAKHGSEEKVYSFLKKELERAHQVYFVYPLIEKSESLDLKDAKTMFEKLREVFNSYNIALIHSKLREDEKEAIMEAFYKREIDILVATSVIEVGIDNPNATCLVIEHAERFGLSTLHQIRGRVGRGEKQSYFFLLYKEPLSENAKFRLKVIKENLDGFAIAEEDLKLRGAGNFLGVEQTGFLKLKIASFERDKSIFFLMREELDLFFKNKTQYNGADISLIERLLKSYLNYANI